MQLSPVDRLCKTKIPLHAFFLGVHIAIHSVDAALDKCTEEKCLQWKSREIVFEAHFFRFLLHSNPKRLSILYIIIGLLTQKKVCAAFAQSFSSQRREKIWHERKNDCIWNGMAFWKPIKLWPLRWHTKRSQLHALSCMLVDQVHRANVWVCDRTQLNYHRLEWLISWSNYLRFSEWKNKTVLSLSLCSNKNQFTIWHIFFCSNETLTTPSPTSQSHEINSDIFVAN